MSFASSLTSHLRRVPGPQDPTPGHGRRTIISHVDRWFVTTAAEGTARGALLVVDVDIDNALPEVGHPPVLSVVGSDDAGVWHAARTANPPGAGDAPRSLVAAARLSADTVTESPADAAGHERDVADDLRDKDPDALRRARLGRCVARAISAHVRAGDAVARIDAGRFAVLRGSVIEGGSARAEAVALARGIEDALVGRPEGFGVRVTAGGVALAADAPREGRSVLGAVTTAMLEGKLLTDDRVVIAVAPAG